MADDSQRPAPDGLRPASIPKPPSEAEIAQVSQDQALIADEWGDEPPPGGAPSER